MDKEKNCSNCYYFRWSVRSNRDWDETVYHCDLHNLHNGEVSWPEEQFCGDEHWLPSKIKRRIDNLNELGI